MFLLASKKGYMTYDQFIQISKQRLSSPVLRLSSDSDECPGKSLFPGPSSTKPLAPHGSSLSKNSLYLPKKNKKLVSIFDSPDTKTVPFRCFKKQTLDDPARQIEITKQAKTEKSEQNPEKKEGFKEPEAKEPEIVRNGFGVQIFRDGSRFKGHFRSNQVHGRGELLYTNGTKVIGKWRRNQLVSGSIVYESGATFKGEFQQLENAKGVASGECFKKGRFYFTDGRYFEGTWSKRGALLNGYLYENKFRCCRLRNDDLPFVMKSVTQRGMGIIINKRWMYEGMLKQGRMAGRGWIYEPFNCSYIRTDWDMNSLGRDFEFRYINEDVFYKKEFESAGGKIRKVRVFSPTGIIFEKDFDKKNENFGILRFMFEDLAGVFQGKVDSCEKIRVFDGEYISKQLRIRLKIFFDQEKRCIFLVDNQFLAIAAFKDYAQSVIDAKKEEKTQSKKEKTANVDESFSILKNPETKNVYVNEEEEQIEKKKILHQESDTEVELADQSEEVKANEDEPKEELVESFSESENSLKSEEVTPVDPKREESTKFEQVDMREVTLEESVKKVLTQLEPRLIERLVDNMEKTQSDFNEVDNLSESFTSEKASICSDVPTVQDKIDEPILIDSQSESLHEEKADVQEKKEESTVLVEKEKEGEEMADSCLDISMISEIEQQGIVKEELEIQIQGLDLVSEQLALPFSEEPSFQEPEPTKQEQGDSFEDAKSEQKSQKQEELKEKFEEVESEGNDPHTPSMSFTSFNSKVSENHSFLNLQNGQTPKKEKEESLFEHEMLDLGEEFEAELLEKPEKKEKEQKEQQKLQEFEDSFELFDD